MALDWGEVRIGVAVSDPDGKIAFPLDRFIENKKATAEIKKIVENLNVEKIVIGMPKTLKGEKGPSAKKVQDFINKLQEQVSCEVGFLDERFTSVEAGNELAAMGLNEKNQRPIKDNIAAQIMLQQYLDQKSK